jgi:hypothetical protein
MPTNNEIHPTGKTSFKRTDVSYCDMRPESWNLHIHWEELHEARSCSNIKYTITLGSDGAFGDISMVMTF